MLYDKYFTCNDICFNKKEIQSIQQIYFQRILTIEKCQKNKTYWVINE
jgi:hypothetical protein